MKSLYIAGPINGVKNYRERFEAAALAARALGWAVLNPATLPVGLPNDRYLPTCLMMLNSADAVMLLEGWEDSAGAMIEKLFAEYQGKEILLQKYVVGNIPRAIRERRD